MKLLAIETSCDETAVCLIEASGAFGPEFRFRLLGNALFSQAALHATYGGVFPNLAKREHEKNLTPLLESALREAGMLRAANGSTSPPALGEILAREEGMRAALEAFLLAYETPAIDAIAVTRGPGLEPALWMGVNFAKALSVAWDTPIVPVNHLEGHILLSLTNLDLHPDTSQKSEVLGLRPFEFPLLALLVSGGHTELALSRSLLSYELIGRTRDDAAGEAFDKAARLLGLPYPGGAELSRLAACARHDEMTSHRFSLPRPMLRENNYDFSFSGLKTAVRKLVENSQPLSDEDRMAIAREFEDAVAEVLVEKTVRAAEELGAPTVILGGGVSANSCIRAKLEKALADRAGAALLAPPPEWATDNALMIALAGYFRALRGEFADPAALAAQGNLALSVPIL